MATSGKSLNLGAHLSISGGIPAAMVMCRDIGASNLQFFTRNPRGGKQRDLLDDELDRGRELRREYGIRTWIAHLPYTVNMASPRSRAYGFAKEVMHSDLRWADRIGAEFVVVHPGSHVGEGIEAGIERIEYIVRHALKGYEGETMLLLEAMAGQGTEVGGRPSELAEIIERCDGHSSLGVCLDTCHQFAAGFDLRTTEGVEEMVREFDRTVGLDRVRCLHLNDSKATLGSHRDRHELIGRGELGDEGIRSVITHPALSSLPMCIETPVDDRMQYKDEIRAVMEILRHA